VRIRSIVVCIIAALSLSVVSLSAVPSAVADAAMKGEIATVRSLIAQKEDVNSPQADGTTALHWAAFQFNLEMVDLLIQAGAKVKVANREGVTPLAIASLYGNASIVTRLLTAGADAKERGSNGVTVLMLAARNGDADTVWTLLTHGADVNAKETTSERTALMWAVDQDHPAAVRALIVGGANLGALPADSAYRKERTQIPDTNSTVPDDSVLPQWSGTLKAVLEARKSFFETLREVSRPETDKPKLTLEGAERCEILNIDFAEIYTCNFLLLAKSKVERQNEYIRLMRLVEKATAESASNAVVESDDSRKENRHVDIGGVSVSESWNVQNYPLGNELLVEVFANKRTNVSTASVSGNVISDIQQSGRYTEMPKAQRVGSSGIGLVSIKVTNSTSYTLNLAYEGNASKTLTVAPHSTETIQLPAGSFKVLGRVSAPNVLPLIGSETYGPGDNMTIDFYIQ